MARFSQDRLHSGALNFTEWRVSSPWLLFHLCQGLLYLECFQSFTSEYVHLLVISSLAFVDLLRMYIVMCMRNLDFCILLQFSVLYLESTTVLSMKI